MAEHNRNGLAVAEWLQARPEMAHVHFPGLSTHPQATVFHQQMRADGALVSFELAGGEEAARRFFDRLRVIVHAVSLGGMESLATRPAMSSHRDMRPEARRRAGISDGRVRLSVGVERLADIHADLDYALSPAERLAFAAGESKPRTGRFAAGSGLAKCRSG
jgi:methionine-gamma-lyase